MTKIVSCYTPFYIGICIALGALIFLLPTGCVGESRCWFKNVVICPKKIAAFALWTSFKMGLALGSKLRMSCGKCTSVSVGCRGHFERVCANIPITCLYLVPENTTVSYRRLACYSIEENSDRIPTTDFVICYELFKLVFDGLQTCGANSLLQAPLHLWTILDVITTYCCGKALQEVYYC